MKARTLTLGRRGALVAITLLALAGCGRLNRTATINQVTTTSGAAAAAALQQHLASQGVSGAHVTCAKKLIVNVRTINSCVLTGAGGKSAVRFTFSSKHGDIKAASVQPTS